MRKLDAREIELFVQPVTDLLSARCGYNCDAPCANCQVCGHLRPESVAHALKDVYASAE